MNSRMIALILIFLLIPNVGCAVNSSGYDTPESMVVDPDTGAYFVSNIRGELTAKDGDGYISKITANGTTIIQKFIGGTQTMGVLDAPKGLWVNKDQLIVTDIDAVKIFDKVTGKLARKLDLSTWNAAFLNDVVMDGKGMIFVSDLVANKIFKIDPSKDFEITIFKEGSELGGPNGLMINPRNGKLTFVTWNTGEIIEVDPDGKLHRLKRGLKTLDGVDYDVEGNLYVSSFDNGEVYRIPFFGRGTISSFLTGLNSPADIGVDRKKHELMVPSFKGNTVTTYPLFLKKKEKLESASGPEKNPPDQSEDGQKNGQAVP